jgi:hypothetical protein
MIWLYLEGILWMLIGVACGMLAALLITGTI